LRLSGGRRASQIVDDRPDLVVVEADAAERVFGNPNRK